MLLILVLFGVIFSGFLLVNSFYKKGSLLEKICLGFLIGLNLFTFLMFLSNWAGFELSLRNVSFLLIALNSVALLANLLLKRLNFNIKKIKHLGNLKKFSYGPKLISVLIITFLFVSVILANFYWPIKDWDALTLYDFRGKVFAETRNMYSAFEIHRYYLAYPLFTSLAHTLVYISGFNNPQFIYGLIYFSFVLLFFLNLRKRISHSFSLFFTLLLALTFPIFQHSTIAYTNLPYAVFLVLSFIYLIFWIEDKNWGDLFISMLLVSGSVWTRHSEPFWIVSLIAILLFSGSKDRFKAFLPYLLGIFATRFAWVQYVALQSKRFPSKSSLELSLLSNINVNLLISRFFEVTTYYWQYVLKPQVLILIVYFSVFLILIGNRTLTSKFFRYIVLANLAIVFGGIYFVSLVYPKWVLIGDSVSRMSQFLTPLIIYISAIVLHSELDKRNAKLIK